MSWVLNCLMKEITILSSLLKKNNHLNVTSLVDPGEYQNMIIKYLSVGLQSWFTYQQVAWNTLFQMRYDSLPNSEKQPCDSQRGWSNSCFHISLILFLLPASKTCLSNLVSHSVTSWSRWGYHISFERGDLGLYTDTKNWKFSFK